MVSASAPFHTNSPELTYLTLPSASSILNLMIRRQAYHLTTYNIIKTDLR